MGKRILFIGPMPPPMGGVSIHILRLSRLLLNYFSIDYIDESKSIKPEFFNLRSMKFLQYFKKIKKADLIYVHSGSRLLLMFHLISGKILRKKIILTLHGYPITKRNLAVRFDEYFYSLSDSIIVVNEYILKRISLPSAKCIVKHAFIPPLMNEESDLPLFLKDWIANKKKSGKIIICANAYQLRIYNGHDLYGLDMCIAAASDLIGKGLPLSFIFNVSSLEKNRDLYENYLADIVAKNLKENFLLINEELSFVKLLTDSDIVLRPTNSDGDALTIREAIHFGKPVISSDVIPRPDDTILFKSRDIIDFENKIIETVGKISGSDNNTQKKQKTEYQIFYKDLINSLLDN
jgi:glycosyltransferase involved in cell wall biosynthesis